MSGNRAAFSLATCFSTAWMQEVEQRRSSCRGGAKESSSPSGAKTRLKNIAIAIHLILSLYHRECLHNISY